MKRADVIDLSVVLSLVLIGLAVALWVGRPHPAHTPDCAYVYTRQIRGDDGRYHPEHYIRTDYRCTGATP